MIFIGLVLQRVYTIKRLDSPITFSKGVMMFRNMLLTISCAAGLLINTAQATPLNTHVMQMGSGYDFELPPQQPQTLSNPFVWEVTAICTVSSDAEDFMASFKVIRKKGTLNGKKMSAGESAQLMLHAKDKIKITAVAGAEMELTNLGEKTARAECTIS